MPLFAARLGSFGALLFSSRWDRARIEDFQNRRLRELVHHAYEKTAFYRELYDQHGVRPGDIRGLGDLHRLPIARRSVMQTRPGVDLVARGFQPSRLRTYRTTGTTGSPFSIRRTWFEDRLLHAARVLEMRRRGQSWTGMRVLVSVGNVASGQNPSAVSAYERLGILPLRRVSCLLPAAEALGQIAALQPRSLGGYPGALASLAREATPEHRSKIKPDLIHCGGETLTPDMRLALTGSFGGRVYDAYGAHEFNLLAVECTETGLRHVCEALVIIEVLKDGKPAKPGESGELVATALHSFAMPFIRYRLRDVVTLGPSRCPCGAPCQTLEEIQGRTMDYFRLPDGSDFHPYRITRVLVQESPWIRRYQIVQTAIDEILVKVVALPGHTATREDLERIRIHVEEGAGQGVRCAVEVADDLPTGKSGKFRLYVPLASCETSRRPQETDSRS